MSTNMTPERELHLRNRQKLLSLEPGFDAAMTPVDVNPGRHPKHDNPRKGQIWGGECNRTVCPDYGAVFWNMGTYGLYCGWCAHEINKGNRGRPLLCVEVEEKPKLEHHETFKVEHKYNEIWK